MAGRLVKRGGVLIDLLARWKAGFRALPIGAGGYITGITSVGGVLYCKTDVGGAYRWNATTSTWKQLITATSVTSNRSVFDYRVEALAAAPSNPDVVYIATGNGSGGLIRASSDGGTTWTTTSTSTFYIAGNEANRFGGQRIAIDPTNPLVAYFGPRKGGAFTTSDGGATWTQMSGMPSTVGDSATTGALGVPCIVIDRDSTVVNGRHQHIWASVFGVGLVHSTDGGTTWGTLAAWTPTGGWVSDIVQAPNGDLIAAFYDPGNTSRVKRITQTGTVTNIDPGTGGWQFVAIDPNTPNTMFISNRAMNVNFNTKRTTDGGTTWQAMTTVTWAGSSAAWLAGTVMATAAPWYLGQAVYHNGSLLIAESHAVWKATVLSGNAVTWQSMNDGIEELTANVVFKPVGHPLLTNEWDYGLFSCPTGSSAFLPFQTTLTSGWDLAASPTDHNFIVTILDDVNDSTDRGSGYSADGGATWTRFPYLTGSPAADLHYGNIAVSASNNNNIVWIPSNLTGTSSKIYYSTDKGTTFTPATLTGLTSTDTLHGTHYIARHILTAHPSTAGTFLALGNGAGGTPVIWKSTDSGATWTKQTTTGLAGDFSSGANLLTDGTGFWAVPTSGTGIYYSTDGTTWTAKTAVSNVTGLGIGAAMPGSSNLTLYTYGTATAGTGILQSRDNGATWQLLAGYPLGNYAGIRYIGGDLEVPGKLYVAFAGGTGFAYGQF